MMYVRNYSSDNSKNIIIKYSSRKDRNIQLMKQYFSNLMKIIERLLRVKS